MLPGFPKQITTTKLAPGRYRVERDDGFHITACFDTKEDVWVAGSWAYSSLHFLKEAIRTGDNPRDKLIAEAGLVVYLENTAVADPKGDPIDYLLFEMQRRNISRLELVTSIGTRTRVSEVLARKRRLSLPMIRALRRYFGLSPDKLIDSYKLSK